MTKINMKDQTIGIEIEMTGITRRAVAEIIKEHTGGCIGWKASGGAIVTAADGRKWDVKFDGSIKGHSRPAPGRKMVPTNDYEWRPEIASPILTYQDIPMIQELIRKLFQAGARSSQDLGCGIHIHIGANNHNVKTLRNLVNIMSSK